MRDRMMNQNSTYKLPKEIFINDSDGLAFKVIFLFVIIIIINQSIIQSVSIHKLQQASSSSTTSPSHLHDFNHHFFNTNNNQKTSQWLLP